jgi:hypothetical protein
VLAQHLTTLALAGGFVADAAFTEVRMTHAYAALERTMFDAVLAFLVHGGALHAPFRHVKRRAIGNVTINPHDVPAHELDQIMWAAKATRTVDRDICLEQLRSPHLRSHQMFLQRELFQPVGKLRESMEAAHLGHSRS